MEIPKGVDVPKGMKYIPGPIVDEKHKRELRMKLWCDAYETLIANRKPPDTSLYYANCAIRDFDKTFGGPSVIDTITCLPVTPAAQEYTSDGDVLFRVGVEAHPNTRQVLDDLSNHVRSTQANQRSPITVKLLPLWTKLRGRSDVRASKIRAVISKSHRTCSYGPNAQLFLQDNPMQSPVEVDCGWFSQRRPEAGGYYVVYGNGNTGYIPGVMFESSYTRG